jgi:multidrug resistance efflux pump
MAMNELEQRLVGLDLIIARTKPLRDRQEKDLKRVKSYKADGVAAKELLDQTKKTLKSAKAERKAIIAKLLKAADAAAKKPERRTTHAS